MQKTHIYPRRRHLEFWQMSAAAGDSVLLELSPSAVQSLIREGKREGNRYRSKREITPDGVVAYRVWKTFGHPRPEPTPGQRPGGNLTYPWPTTPVGGTFDIPAGPNQPLLTSMQERCRRVRRAGKGDFICHQHPDGLIQVYRRG